MRDSTSDTSSVAEIPCGIDHIVLHVRNLDESHVFWTEYLGFQHVGTFRRGLPEGTKPTTRFYSAQLDGALSHHTIALVEEPEVLAMRTSSEIDHLAISYANEAAWRRQVQYLESRGVQLSRKVKRGTIGSTHVCDPNGYVIELVYQLPREVWSSDIDAALNQPPVELS